MVDKPVVSRRDFAFSFGMCVIYFVWLNFSNSVDRSEIVQYTYVNSTLYLWALKSCNTSPPTDCGAPGSWAGVTLNFTVTSNGTQFDRLGIFTFQNVEIWRTSTPEPTAAGIIWTYIKDVTRFTPLFAKPGTFILQLDNLIQVSRRDFAQ